ncbi:MAG: PTS sugar transporter subunit IIA [Granulosicoccus sp.]|nr:PTS sugar transporter subunit IIA [Granulosicoccus sp.]
MDLPELLSPERIRCRCDCKSKKRTLQTVAEILGESLRADTSHDEWASEDEENVASSEGATIRLTKKILKGRGKTEQSPELPTDMAILDALISRERLGSTALGHGVGLPHSRLCSVAQPLAALVTLETGVDYESDDSQPVDLVLGLLVPEHCNDEHLKILAQLATRFSDPSLRENLRNFSNENKLYEFVNSLPPLN